MTSENRINPLPAVRRGFAFLLITGLLPALALGAEADTERAAELVGQGAMVIDVRSDAEVEAGTVPGALTIPHDQLKRLKAVIGKNRSRPVVLYCGSGRRAGLAIDALEAAGYGGGGLVNGGGYEAMMTALETPEPE